MLTVAVEGAAITKRSSYTGGMTVIRATCAIRTQWRRSHYDTDLKSASALAKH